MLLEPGNPRLILISGSNGGGKSFLVKALGSYLHLEAKGKVEWMAVGMSLRTSPGMARAFMFGDEGRESTGRISLKAVLGGLRTCKGREHPHALILDEPDVGLSEGYQAGLGELLSDFAGDLPALTRALIVVTHSRTIAKALSDAGATCVRIGDDLRPTADWIRDGDSPRTAKDIEELSDRTIARMRAIQAVINQESRGNPNDVSPVNTNGTRDYGLMQLSTKNPGAINWKDPATNMGIVVHNLGRNGYYLRSFTQPSSSGDPMAILSGHPYHRGQSA